MPGRDKMRTTRIHVVIIILTFIFMSRSAYSGGDDIVEPKNPDNSIFVGKKLFNSTGCFACHGDGAQGGIGKDLTRSKKNEERMAKIITNGVKGTMMGPFKSKLSPEEIENIIIYLKSLTR